MPVIRGEHKRPDGIFFSRIWRDFPGVFDRQRLAILVSFDMYCLSSLCYLGSIEAKSGSTYVKHTIQV